VQIALSIEGLWLIARWENSGMSGVTGSIERGVVEALGLGDGRGSSEALMRPLLCK
jgi:hypothetical protein